MTPLISKWHRELELFSAVKPLIILEGNVLDICRYPVEGSIPEDKLVSLPEYLHGYLTDNGYSQVVFYSNLVGFMNPYKKETLVGFAKNNGCEIKSGAIPAEFKGNSQQTAPNIIRRAMSQTNAATAVVMELASHYIITPERMDQHDVNSFNLLMQSAMSAATVRTPMGKRQNLLILLVSKLNDLPAWFYLGNPLCKTIRIEAPDREERKRLISGRAWPTFFDSTVYRTDMPFYEQHPEELARLREKFVGLTEGLTFTELDAMRRLSKREQTPIRDLCSIVDLYKYGIKENPWQNLSMESSSQGCSLMPYLYRSTMVHSSRLGVHSCLLRRRMASSSVKVSPSVRPSNFSRSRSSSWGCSR